MSNILKLLRPLDDVASTKTTISVWTQQKITGTRRTLCIFYYIIYYVNYSAPFMSARSVPTARWHSFAIRVYIAFPGKHV